MPPFSLSLYREQYRSDDGTGNALPDVDYALGLAVPLAMAGITGRCLFICAGRR